MISEIKFHNTNNTYSLCDYKIENTNVLPDDIIEYEINRNGNGINIIRLIYRHQIITIAIINEYNNFYLPMYNTKIDNNLMTNFEFGTRLIIKIDLSGIFVIKQYDSINNRNNDDEIALDLYLQTNNMFNIPILKKSTTKAILELDDQQLDLTMLDTFTISDDIKIFHDNGFSVNNHVIYVHTINISHYIDFHSNKMRYAFIKSKSLYFRKSRNIQLFDNCNEISLNDIGVNRHVITVEINTQTNEITGPYQSIINIKTHYTYNNFNHNDYPFLKQYINDNMFWSEINIPKRELIIDEIGYMTDINLIDVNNFNVKVSETLLIKMNIYISNLINSNSNSNSNSSSNSNSNSNSNFNLKLNSKKTVKLTNSNHKHTLSFSQSIIKVHQMNNEKLKHSNLSQISYVSCTSPLNSYCDVIIQQLLYGIKYDNMNDIFSFLNFRDEIYNGVVKLYESWKIDTFIEFNKVSVEYIKTLNKYYIPQFVYELDQMNPLHKYVISRDF